MGARPSSFAKAEVPVASVPVRVWSEQQEDAFKWFYYGKQCRCLYDPCNCPQHLMLRARAGCGKSSTIAEGVNRAAEDPIWVCAFGKQTQRALSSMVTNPNAETTTVHSMGLRFIRRKWSGMPVEEKRHLRAESLTTLVVDKSVPKPIRTLISTLHTKGREMMPLNPTLVQLLYLAEFFDLVPDDGWVDYDTNFIAEHALMAMQIAADVAPTRDVGVDFADMVYLPLAWDLLTPDYPLVVGDEVQDLTFAQLQFIQRLCSGRICLVGDEKQSIFKFRGADSGGMDRLKAELNATELPLNVTYRCCQAVVREAQKLVPDIQAAEGNPEGVVDTATYDDMLADAQPTDFILSRLNAPLVIITLRFLIEGRRARMEGRDIGAGILSVLNRLKVGSFAGIGLLLTKLEQWERKSTTKYAGMGMVDLADRCRDQAAMIRAFAERATSVEDLRNRITWLFKDTGDEGTDDEQIVCSSIHKAKGLEAPHVWVLKESLYRRGWSEEEANLDYVATTRAKTHLTFVTGVPRLA